MKNDYRAKTDPTNAWAIHKGKLYLIYDSRIQNKWVQDKEGFIMQADGHWKNKVGERRDLSFLIPK
ncbi:MAG: hypothetical protein GY816_03615 [Cytophagales bacterium]|nr:hypothetical protein [Cytophagales bacterium]